MKKLNKKETSMQVVDMTKGSPVRLILGFAVPMFIGNIFQQFYTMADTMVVRVVQPDFPYCFRNEQRLRNCGEPVLWHP